MWIPTAWARGELGSLVADRRLLALFVVLGAIDAEATFAAVSAYRYTSLFSVQLLDSLTVPMVMALSYAALRVRRLSLPHPPQPSETKPPSQQSTIAFGC